MTPLTRLSGIKLFFFKIIDILSLFNFFNKLAVVFIPSANLFKIEFWRYREYNKPDTTSTLFFENGLILPRPKGEMQYFIINKKKIGSAFIYDNMSLWNVNFKDKEKMMEIIANNAIDKATIVEVINSIDRATITQEEIRTFQNFTLILTGVIAMLVIISAWFIFSSVNNYVSISTQLLSDYATLKKAEYGEAKLRAYEFATKYNISIPEYGIYYDKVQKRVYFVNETQNTNIPSAPSIPSLPNLPTLPTGGE